MKGIEPELDSLMWLIAEEGGTEAAEAFERRHPELRGELARRMTMVRGLRGGKRGLSAPRRVPKFRPRPEPRRPLWPVALASLALVAMAFGSYALTERFLLRKPVEGPPSSVRYLPPDPNAGPEGRVPVVDQRNPTAPGNPAVAPPPVAKIDRPQRFRMEDAPLTAVLTALSLQAGLSFELAPGVRNVPVTADYDYATPAQILKDLGARYGFTAFDQGSDRILIIPATEGGAPASPSNERPPTPPDRTEQPLPAPGRDLGSTEVINRSEETGRGG